MQLRCSPSLYLNLGTCEGYFRHFARASDAWELAQSSLNAWKSVSTRYPTVKYEFYGSDRHFNIWAGLWLFPFPFPTIKAFGHCFRFLIRAYNFRVRIQAPTNPSQERESLIPAIREAVRVHPFVRFALRLPLYPRLTFSANHTTL